MCNIFCTNVSHVPPPLFFHLASITWAELLLFLIGGQILKWLIDALATWRCNQFNRSFFKSSCRKILPEFMALWNISCCCATAFFSQQNGVHILWSYLKVSRPFYRQFLGDFISIPWKKSWTRTQEEGTESIWKSLLGSNSLFLCCFVTSTPLFHLNAKRALFIFESHSWKNPLNYAGKSEILALEKKERIALRISTSFPKKVFKAFWSAFFRSNSRRKCILVWLALTDSSLIVFFGLWRQNATLFCDKMNTFFI